MKQLAKYLGKLHGNIILVIIELKQAYLDALDSARHPKGKGGFIDPNNFNN